MEFLSAFLTSAVEMVIFIAIIVCAVFCGHKLRERKNAKDALLATAEKTDNKEE